MIGAGKKDWGRPPQKNDWGRQKRLGRAKMEKGYVIMVSITIGTIETTPFLQQIT
jgi:hypothetical protein